MSRFDKMFLRRTLRPLGELTPAASPALKAAMKAQRLDEDRPRPIRRFEGLTNAEAAANPGLEWPMWVVVVGPVRSRKLWDAPTKEAWTAAEHNAPAPPDAVLIDAGWRPGDLWPVEESGATE